MRIPLFGSNSKWRIFTEDSSLKIRAKKQSGTWFRMTASWRGCGSIFWCDENYDEMLLSNKYPRSLAQWIGRSLNAMMRWVWDALRSRRCAEFTIFIVAHYASRTHLIWSVSWSGLLCAVTDAAVIRANRQRSSVRHHNESTVWDWTFGLSVSIEDDERWWEREREKAIPVKQF